MKQTQKEHNFNVLWYSDMLFFSFLFPTTQSQRSYLRNQDDDEKKWVSSAMTCTIFLPSLWKRSLLLPALLERLLLPLPENFTLVSVTIVRGQSSLFSASKFISIPLNGILESLFGQTLWTLSHLWVSVWVSTFQFVFPHISGVGQILWLFLDPHILHDLVYLFSDIKGVQESSWIPWNRVSRHFYSGI